MTLHPIGGETHSGIAWGRGYAIAGRGNAVDKVDAGRHKGGG
jgi:hypothetical protein